MCFKVRSFLLAVALLLPLIFLLSCSSSTEQEFEEGRLYVVNNTRPVLNIYGVWVMFEGVRYDTPFNMTEERESTGEGAVELTDTPLPGGMVVEVGYYYLYGKVVNTDTIRVTMDGNMTIDLYMESWEDRTSYVTARLVPGKWDATHSY